MSETNQSPFPSGEMIEAIKDLAVRAAGVSIENIYNPHEDDGRPYSVPVAIVHGDAPKVLSLSEQFEAYRERPRRKEGTAKTLTRESLIDLVNRHKTPHSVIFADTDWRRPSITAVIDYHKSNGDARKVFVKVSEEGGGLLEQRPDLKELADQDAYLGEATVQNIGQPGFGRHRVHYAFPLSEEWQAWVKQDGKPMEQADFAAFIEDHIAELSAPTDAEKIWLERDFQTTVATPAQLIQLSRGLQVHVNAVVKNVVTLQSGEGQLTFDETHVGADGKPLKVPGLFVLNIAPFFMGTAISIPVRLRYRPAGGKVLWFYQIYRPDEHITGRIRADLRQVAEETGLPAYEGSPEMSA